MIASYRNNHSIAKLLCEWGADAAIRNLQGLNSKDMAKSDEMKEYLYQRTQMMSWFDFNDILKIDIQKQLDNPYDSESDEENSNPLYKSVHEMNQQFEEKMKNSKKNNANGDLIARTILNIDRCTISQTSKPKKRSPRKQKR